LATPNPDIAQTGSTPRLTRTIELYGDGTAEVAKNSGSPVRPTKGVLSIFLRRLCGLPETTESLLVVPMRPLNLQRRSNLTKRVWLAKRAAFNLGRDGFVFAQDSEGEATKKLMEQIKAGVSMGLDDFPCVVAVVVPCIESWLLADGTAIKRAMELEQRPTVPEKPEEFCTKKHPGKQYKRHLAQLGGVKHKDLGSEDKNRIAEFIDLLQLSDRCPSFRVFADDTDRDIVQRLFPAQPAPNSDQVDQPPSQPAS
jgi:hypothetical protein